MTVDQVVCGDLAHEHTIASIPVVAQIGAGGEVRFLHPAKEKMRVVGGFAGSNANTVAAEVVGDALGEIFSGWLVYFDDREAGVGPSSIIGQACVVWHRGRAHSSAEGQTRR
jgi:hypothetical protein